MKLEVGMYVRINEDFRTIFLGIGKIVNIVQETVYVKMRWTGLPIAFINKNVAKASHNIIDLIEVGDYVNGREVIKIDETYSDATYTNKYRYLLVRPYNDAIVNKNIKSIVTKEQFSSLAYEVVK